MKALVLILVLSIPFRLFAPADDRLVLADPVPVNPYKKLIYAIGCVETGLDTLAYNPFEEAVGYFQIRPIRLEDYNQRIVSNYDMQDMYDYYISEKIFLYYASQIGPYDFERIAKSWNGSGSMTEDYWKKVKSKL